LTIESCCEDSGTEIEPMALTPMLVALLERLIT